MEHIFESPCSRFFKVRPICDLFRVENVTGTIWGINFGHFEEADFQLSKFHTKLTEMSCIHFTVKYTFTDCIPHETVPTCVYLKTKLYWGPLWVQFCV